MNPFADKCFISALLILLFAAAMIDRRTFKIPNLLTIPGAVGALTYYGVGYGVSGLGFSFAGLGAGLALLIVPYLAGGMGGGDVKLLGMAGAFLGAKAVFVVFLFTAIIGGVYALGVLALHRDARKGILSDLLAISCKIKSRTTTTGARTSGSGRPRLKYGLAIGLGAGLYIVSRTLGFTLL